MTSTDAGDEYLGSRPHVRIVDLASEALVLPPRVMLDTSIIAALWLPASSDHAVLQKQRATSIITYLSAHGVTGYIAYQSSIELAHLIVVREFRGEFLQNGQVHHAVLRARFPDRKRFDWTDLMKVYEQPFVTAATRFRSLCAAFQGSAITFLEPPFPEQADQRLQQFDVLAASIRRYRVDSADAAILLEARRAGLPAIVTFDTDLQRASQDMYIFTWLS